MDSDIEICSGSSTQGSVEVEDFSPPDSPGLNGDIIDGGAGPLPYLFEPIAPAVTVDENMDEPEAARMGEVCEQVGGAACITAHPGFEPVALNTCVLQAVYGTYRQLYGDMENTVLNSCYRHLAYRYFVRWCWGYLGRHIRVVIPSCAVTRIREQFPDNTGTYSGFQPPPLD
uniref:P2X purinoreceptor 7 intracellular domain-containing protein n=1 Tax=Cyprinus carpio TaxID=7962 RepID=A0A8C1UG27_CYPCA